MVISIYTDGACSGNPGPGGWGAIICKPDGSTTEMSGGVQAATNQRMEIESCIQALEALSQEERRNPVLVYSDSAYVVNCFLQKWFVNWRRNGWRNAKKEPVANQDLWESLLNIVQELDNIEFVKVKGHSGVPLNERADVLARRGLTAGKRETSIKNPQVEML